jgi:hypothetical protein
MVTPMRTSRLATVSPLQIIAWAVVWPLVIVLGTIAYVTVVVWRETDGRLAAIGFGWDGSRLGIMAALAILVLPPAALVMSWRRARSRPS